MNREISYKNIVERIEALECKTYPLTNDEIAEVEKTLGINFPPDFKNLNTICSYEYLFFCSSLNFRMHGEYSVTGNTLEWRKSIKFPKNCVALSEEGESAVIMIIKNDNAEVIWCDVPDLYNLCEGKPFEYNPTIFPTFTDFYSFLLDEEEKIRKEG